MKMQVRINDNIVDANCQFTMVNDVLRIVCNVINGNVDSLTIVYDVKNASVKIGVIKNNVGEIVYGPGYVNMRFCNGENGYIWANVYFGDDYSDNVIAGVGLDA